jgi:hypothetical protein
VVAAGQADVDVPQQDGAEGLLERLVGAEQCHSGGAELLVHGEGDGGVAGKTVDVLADHEVQRPRDASGVGHQLVQPAAWVTNSIRLFEVLEKAFSLLVAGPEPLSLDGRLVRELPSRPIPLDELRGRLLHPSISYRTRDVALVLLLRRAKREGGA